MKLVIILHVINFMSLGSNPDIGVLIQTSGFESRLLDTNPDIFGSNPDISGFESRHLSKIKNRRHKQRSGQHTLAHRKNKYKKYTKSIKNCMPGFFIHLLVIDILFFVKPLLCRAAEK
jgi:hypothetical protein